VADVSSLLRRPRRCAERPQRSSADETGKQETRPHPAAQVISAGMSGDLGEAIAEGATHVRIGTALLGGRPPFVR